jgi:hypothetical protein
LATPSPGLERRGPYPSESGRKLYPLIRLSWMLF